MTSCLNGAAGTSRWTHGHPKDHPGDLRSDSGDDSDRWRGSCGVHQDAAGQYGRREGAGAGDRPSSPTLRHRSRLRCGELRDDFSGDDRGPGDARPCSPSGCARAGHDSDPQDCADERQVVRAACDRAPAWRQVFVREGCDDLWRALHRGRNEAEKNLADLRAIIADLDKRLSGGGKVLIGNVSTSRQTAHQCQYAALPHRHQHLPWTAGLAWPGKSHGGASLPWDVAVASRRAVSAAPATGCFERINRRS